VISIVEKNFAKTQAFDWFRYFVIQNTSIWLVSLFPFRNGVETNSTTRRREIFLRETFQNHVAHAFNLFARNFSHFARRGIRPIRIAEMTDVQPRWIIFNKVDTKDLCTVRYSSTSNKGFLFCGFEVCQASRPSYLDRLCTNADKNITSWRR
jgi:hypothetical protein